VAQRWTGSVRRRLTSKRKNSGPGSETIEYRKAYQPDHVSQEISVWNDLVAEAKTEVKRACKGQGENWMKPVTKHVERLRNGGAVVNIDKPNEGTISGKSFEKQARLILTNFADSFIFAENHGGPLRANSIEWGVRKLKSDVENLISHSKGVNDQDAGAVRQFARRQAMRAEQAVANHRAAKPGVTDREAILNAMRILVPIARIVKDVHSNELDPVATASELVENNLNLMPWAQKLLDELKKQVSEILGTV